jgi:hypothetical protein
MPSCWFSGANNSHPAEGAAGSPDSKLCLPLSGFEGHFQQPGDGRTQPHISATDIVWALVVSRILRVTSFLRLEWLVHSAARVGLGVKAGLWR